MNREYSVNQKLIENFLDIVTPVDGIPLSLIVSTNAGSQTFSLIATALKQLRGQSIDLIALITTSPDSQSYIQISGQIETSLGAIKIAEQPALQLRHFLPDLNEVKTDRRKTSQLVNDHFSITGPFIKAVAPDAKVLPLLIPAEQIELYGKIGQILAEILTNRKAVVIAQADLNESQLAALEFQDLGAFLDTAHTQQPPARKRSEEEYLSALPAAAALTYAQGCGSNTVSVLQQSKRENLFHAAVMLWNYKPPELDHSMTRELLKSAHSAIRNHVESGIIPEYEPEDAVLMRKAGAFVTLRIAGMLRGCIGHMSAERPLGKIVQEMAVAAATSDPRFPPLTKQELDQIALKVAILSPLRRIRVQDIEVGKHGLLITHQGRRGVLLPEVASERGWDKDTFLEHLCYKAGLPGNILLQNPKLYAFTSIVFGDEEISY